MTGLPNVDPPTLALALLEAATRNVILAARALALVTHGNLAGDAYRRREQLIDDLRDAIAELDLHEAKPAA